MVNSLQINISLSEKKSLKRSSFLFSFWAEIKKITEQFTLLKNSKDKLKKLADRLLEKEVIFKDDLEIILGKRPYKTNDEKIEEFKASREKK